MRRFRPRRPRSQRDMIVLGGWLFADLLLGLAMLFLTANTVGQAPPTATPPPTANLLATSEAANAAIQADLDSAAATATANAESAGGPEQRRRQRSGGGGVRAPNR